MLCYVLMKASYGVGAQGLNSMFALTGPSCTEASLRAQQLLEHSLLGELRAIVARALSGLDMFAGSGLSELDLLPTESSSVEILSVRHVPHVLVRHSLMACMRCPAGL